MVIVIMIEMVIALDTPFIFIDTEWTNIDESFRKAENIKFLMLIAEEILATGYLNLNRSSC